MITFESKGSFEDTERWLKRMSKNDIFSSLDRYGAEGTAALESATPIDTRITAGSWSHEVLRDGKSWSIIWSNSNVVGDTPVVILLQYGHGTRTGGYVQGQDFINPALQPIFDKIATEVWKEVTRR